MRREDESGKKRRKSRKNDFLLHVVIFTHTMNETSKLVPTYIATYQLLAEAIDNIKKMCTDMHELLINQCHTWLSTRFRNAIHVMSDGHLFLVIIENDNIIYGQRTDNDRYIQTYRLWKNDYVRWSVDNKHVNEMTIWLVESYLSTQPVTIIHKIHNE